MQTRPRLALLLLALGLGLEMACGGSGSGSSPEAHPQVSVSFTPYASSTDTDSVTLHAVVTGTSNTAVTWSVKESDGGAVLPTSDPMVALYQPPDPKAGTFHVRATSAADSSRFAEAVITVVHPIQISVSSGGFLHYGASKQFTATVTRSADTQVAWTCMGPDSGALDANGLFTAPPVPGSYLVRATSHADPSRSDASTVIVYDSASTVTLTPASAATAPGGTLTFNVALSPENPATFVSFWLEENAANSISMPSPGTLVLQAPTEKGTYHLHVQYFEDPNLEAVATVVVN